MKLDYKRTVFVGFAFFLICAFWQAYDAIVPLILTNKFGMNQTWSGVIMALDNVLALFMLPLFGALSDKTTSKMGRRTPYILFGTIAAVLAMQMLGFADSLQTVSLADYGSAQAATASNPWVLVIFILALLLVLFSMAIFRSPAVALMPDVTLKPLRSKANAVINLMGTAGGIITLMLGMVFGTGKAENAAMGYQGYFLCVGLVMLAALAVFMRKVREPAFVEQMQQEAGRYGLEEEKDNTPEAERKLAKEERRSLLFILASVVFWFFGYNAVTSKYSVYAANVLGTDFNANLLIATASAVIAYIPVGFVASKIGRKKTILAGIVILSVTFGLCAFIRSDTPAMVMDILFVFAGIGWATINVNSYPMVVELARGSDVGKYTGYYYTASMAAQTLTPILSGKLLDINMRSLFPYGSICVLLALVTMSFVHHGDSKPAAVAGLEALDVDMD